MKVRRSYFVVRYRGGVSTKICEFTVLRFSSELVFAALANVAYFFWAAYKLKNPVFRLVKISRLPTGFSFAHINYCNGTEVYVFKKYVLKYYFLNLLLVNSICEELNSCRVYRRANVVLMKSLRHREVGALPSDDEILELLSRSMQGVDLFNKEELSFSCRLKIALDNNPSIGAKGKLFVLRLYEMLESIGRNYEKSAAHGDVWLSNILRDKNGVLILIDFDKMVYAPKHYDSVYFSFMNDSRCSRTSPWIWIDKPGELLEVLQANSLFLPNKHYQVAMFYLILMKCAESNPVPKMAEKKYLSIMDLWERRLLNLIN